MDEKTATLPRECRELRDSINELYAAMKHGDKQTIAAAVETLERDRSRANKAYILLSSQGGHLPHLAAYCDCLNDSLQARARGFRAVNGLGF